MIQITTETKLIYRNIEKNITLNLLTETYSKF